VATRYHKHATNYLSGVCPTTGFSCSIRFICNEARHEIADFSPPDPRRYLHNLKGKKTPPGGAPGGVGSRYAALAGDQKLALTEPTTVAWQYLVPPKHWLLDRSVS
jgi:hypothetical protein